VTDGDYDDDTKDGCSSVTNDHTVRFFIINNTSRTTSRTGTSDDEDDDDDDALSLDESNDASRVELIVDQVGRQEPTPFY